MALIAAPFILAMFALLGRTLAVPLAQWHPESRLAEQVRLEELGVVDLTTDASDAFRGSGRSVDELYQSAISRREHFLTLGGLLGGWTGFVVSRQIDSLVVAPPSR